LPGPHIAYFDDGCNLRRFGASDFADRAEVSGEVFADVGHKELFYAHPAPRQALLVHVGDKGLKGGAAPFNGIVPDVLSKDLPQVFQFIDLINLAFYARSWRNRLWLFFIF